MAPPVKQLKRSATVAWSPDAASAHLMAAATMAGSLDGSFDTSASVELIDTGLSRAGSDMSVVGRCAVSDRIHRLQWGRCESRPMGLLAAGMGDGTVQLWDPAVLQEAGSGDDDSDREARVVLNSTAKHTATVQALDFNPVQETLLASGGADSALYVWDVSNPTAPTVYKPGTPTAGSQNAQNVTCVQWNKSVQHILASASYSGVTVIWDLKNKKPVISFTDPNRKQRCKALAWNPAEATQIITASEDDDQPVLSVWDLRNTYAPARYLEGHTRGIWSVSWSSFDPALLLSTGKDNRTLCWNTETGRVMCEVESTEQWNFDVQWSPCVPAMLSTCSLEGTIKLFSLVDTTPPAPKPADPNDPFAPKQEPVDASVQERAPKWLRRPCGASFGFGGRLVRFGTSGPVQISHVASHPDLLDRVDKLEEALGSGDFQRFCEEKVAAAQSDRDRTVWAFLKVLFEPDARQQLLTYLGFDPADTLRIVNEFVANLPEDSGDDDSGNGGDGDGDGDADGNGEDDAAADTAVEADEPGSGEEAKGHADEDEDTGPDFFGGGAGAGGDDPFAALVNSQATPAAAGAGAGAAAAAAPGDAAADAPAADAAEDGADNEASAAAIKPVAKPANPIVFPETDDVEVTMMKALMIGNFEAAVRCSMRTGRVAEALVLAACGGPELLKSAQEEFFRRQRNNPFMRVVSAVVSGELESLVATTDLRFWKHALALLCTYGKTDQFEPLCDLLARRLELAGDLHSATLCFMWAGNIDKTMQVWVGSESDGGYDKLQDLIEKVAVLRHASDSNKTSAALASKYSQYAELLAANGRVGPALRYLQSLNVDAQSPAGILLDRLYHAMPSSERQQGMSAPANPFAAPAQVPVQPQSQQQQAQFQQTPSGVGAGAAPVAAQNVGMPRGGTPQGNAAVAAAFGSAAPAAQQPQSQYQRPAAAAVPYGRGTAPAAVPAPAPMAHQQQRQQARAPAPLQTHPFGGNGGNGGGASPHQSPLGSGGRGGGVQGQSPAAVAAAPVKRAAPPAAAPAAVPAPAPRAAPAAAPAAVSMQQGRGMQQAGQQQQQAGQQSQALQPQAMQQQQQQQQAPAVAAEPAPEPSPESRALMGEVEALLTGMNEAVASNPGKKRKVDDVSKRLGQLVSKLKAASVDASVVGKLGQLIEAVKQGDTATASAVHVQLSQEAWAQLGSQIMLGLKRLIELGQ